MCEPTPADRLIMSLNSFLKYSWMAVVLLAAASLSSATQITATFTSEGGDGYLTQQNVSTPFVNARYSVDVTYNTDNVYQPNTMPNYNRTSLDSAFWTIGDIKREMDVSNLVLDSYNYLYVLGSPNNFFYSDAFLTAQQSFFVSLTDPFAITNAYIAATANTGSVGTTFSSISGDALHISNNQVGGDLIATFALTPTPNPVPEPSTLALMTVPLIGFGIWKRRKV